MTTYCSDQEFENNIRKQLVDCATWEMKRSIKNLQAAIKFGGISDEKELARLRLLLKIEKEVLASRN